MAGAGPAIEMHHVQPQEATGLAVPLQGFLRDTLSGLYVRELGVQMVVHPNPDDMAGDGEVAKQRQRLLDSTDLSIPETSAYVLAVDRDSEAYDGIVGVGKFTRIDEGVVHIEELDVALDRRGERIGPGILEEALGALAVTADDVFTLEVLHQNHPARKFWRGMGFRLTGVKQHHGDVFPDPGDYHVQMAAPEPRLHKSVRQRLRGKPLGKP